MAGHIVARSLDLTGRQFGYLTVISRSVIRRHGNTCWECRCVCGKLRTIRQDGLISGHAKSCGCKHKRTPPEERFWRFVTKTDACWFWTGGQQANGYGAFGLGGKYGRQMPAHRFAYQMSVGPIPPALLVCHRCDNPLCVRPDHLFVGTHKDNMADMRAKGRSTKGRRIGGAADTSWAEHHWSRIHPERVRRGEAASTAKLTADQVRSIRARHAAGESNAKQLAAEFGMHPAYIRLVIARKRWKHVA